MNQHSQYIRVLVQPLSRIPTIEPGQGNFDDVIRVFLHLSLVAAVGTITSHLLTFIFSLVSPIVNVIILFVLTNILTTPQTINTDIVLPISVILEVTTSFASPSSPIISCILYSFYAQICIIIALFLLDIKFEVIPSFVFVCLLRSVTPSRSVILRCLIQVSGALIGVTVARIIEQMISLTNPETSDGRLIAWKKRRSSSSSSSSSVKIRRTSLPLLLGSRSHSIGNPVSSGSSIDTTHLSEAHGIITDLLNDPSGILPPNVTCNLRAVASLLAQPSLVPLIKSKSIPSASISLTEYHSDSNALDHPFLMERPSALNKRGKRPIAPNILRRMSTSTWSTTTSATGMPLLEPEPTRKRCTSFRAASSPIGGPPTLSPTAPFPHKSRSFSTTAIPAGAFAQFSQSSKDWMKKEEHLKEVTEEVDESSSSAPSPLLNKNPEIEPIKFRATLTSDYDTSSNDSTSGSEVALDDVPLIAEKQAFESIQQATSVTAKIELEASDLNCVLCGQKRKTSSKIIARWPNAPPDPPLVSSLDSSGRYIVMDMTYDLEELSVDPLLNLINEWDFPIFEMQDVAGDAILSEMSYRIFLETGLFEAFKIPIQEFLNYFRALDKGYREKPYHNRMHAADVLHGVYYLTTQPIPGFAQIPAESVESPLQNTSLGPLPQTYVRHISVCEETYGILGANFPALELMALYTAAAMHDFDHPGRTNAFLVSTFAPIALAYNDRSVLESYHAAAAWSLFFSSSDYNWLRSLDTSEFKRFRFLVIEFILATDLKRHFEILAEFNTKVNEEECVGIDWVSETDRLLVMEVCIKLADINGPCKRRDIHLQWTHRIAEEFYEQGDDEAKMNFPISPFMDRRHPQLAKLQESFINHLVAPLCNAMASAGLLPGLWSSKVSSLDPEEKSAERSIVCLQTRHLTENYDYWIKILQEQNQRSGSLESSSSDGSSTPVLNQELTEIAEETQEDSQDEEESDSEKDEDEKQERNKDSTDIGLNYNKLEEEASELNK